MNRRRNLHRFPFFRRHRFFTISFVQEWCHCASGGGGSKGVLSDVGVGSGDDDDSTCFSDADEVSSRATESALR